MTDEFYTQNQRTLQDAAGSRDLADAFEATIVSGEVSDEDRTFIESRDFFFLSTVTASGSPTVSYKGGGVGVVTVIDNTTIAFPSYDGNGMFLSMGNIAETAKIGLLFMDFETPHRLRVQATASISTEQSDIARYPGADMVVRASVDQVFPNCGRYIHKHRRVEPSPYVPDSAGGAPLPAWKRIDLIQEVLPQRDQGRAEAEGGTISLDQYSEHVRDGNP